MTNSLKRALTIAAFCGLGALAAARSAQPGATKPQPAQPPPPVPRATGPVRVAIINLTHLQDGLLESKDLGAHIGQLEDEANRRLGEIRDQITKIDNDLELLKEKKESAEYRNLQFQRAEALANGRIRQAVLKQTLEEQQGIALRSMFLKMTAAIQAVADRDHWDLVVRDDREIVPPEKRRDSDGMTDRPLTSTEVKQIIDPRTVYAASAAIDITPDVITQMNNDYKAAKR